ncbi:MAG: hypothetical protein ACR652_22545 [Methylocystis sp.]|uniref:hypothetical protein n=1 Tax=Methylocystis sp. TaxID=1911079 RepID=UPI003DA4AD1E
MTLGSGVAALQAAGVPRVVVAADDASSHARAARDGASDADEAPSSSGRRLTLKAMRLLCAGVAYFCAGLAGWSLYELAPAYISALSLPPAAPPAQKASEAAQLLQATQKIAAQLQALQTRVDALGAAPRREEKDAPTAPNVEELNRRIDAAKNETATEIRQLSSNVEQLQREMNARLAEIGAASRQAERAASEAAAAVAPPRLATTVRVEEGYRPGHRRHGDAFDPTLHPNAPGAPRPLRARLGSVP